MKTQKHNQGDLEELTVKIEKNVVESLKTMSQNSQLSVDEIVVIALKRFRASHSDYMGKIPDSE
jgi:fructose-1,6-bisphosphatase/sedoheptulose 1,7-bisphosphatase-like protein